MYDKPLIVVALESEYKNPIFRNTLYTEFIETKNTLEKR